MASEGHCFLGVFIFRALKKVFLISKNCQFILIKVLVGGQKYRRMVRFLNFSYFKDKSG